MTARILAFPASGRAAQPPTFTDPRLQQLAECFAAAIDKNTGKPIGAQAGGEVARKFQELIEAHRAKGTS